MAQDGGENLLQNPDFEGEFIAVGGDNTLRVAEGWQNWNLPPPAGSDGSTNLRPDYQPAPPTRVSSGSSAQQYDTFFATHTGGILQEVTLSSTGTVTFTANIYPYSSLSFEDIDSSIDPQTLEVSIGIDPNGGTDGGSPDIIWTEPVEYYDRFDELSVSTQATSTTVTVYVRSTVENAPGLHQVFVDDAALTFVAGDPPTVEPTETATETAATETATATETAATETATETETATVTETAATETAVVTETDTSTPVPSTTSETDTSTPAVTETATTDDPTAIARQPYSDALPNEISYTVQAGDTVGLIAERFASESEAIIEFNGLDESGLIFIDQTLLVPVPAGVGRPVASVAPPAGGGEGTGGTPDPSTGDPGATGDVYYVQAGDNLFRIALRYNVSLDVLASYNGIVNPALIYVGQAIRIPPAAVPATGGPVAAATVAPPVTTAPAGTYLVHIVQPGENIFRIGLRYNITWDIIAQANGLYNPNLVFVGQQLVIPQ